MMTTSFIGRFTIYEPKPTKGYVHNFGIIDAFIGEQASVLEAAQNHLTDLIKAKNAQFKNIEFLIAVLWGNHGDKMVDLFGYAKNAAWPGNPEVAAWVFKNGVYQPRQCYITCSDSIRMLGLEEATRRGTRNLEEYMKLSPFLGELQPLY